MRLNSGLCVVLLVSMAGACAQPDEFGDNGDGGTGGTGDGGGTSSGFDGGSVQGQDAGSGLQSGFGFDSGAGLGAESGLPSSNGPGQDGGARSDGSSGTSTGGSSPDGSSGQDAESAVDSGSAKDGASEKDGGSAQDSAAGNDSAAAQDSGPAASGVHAVGNQIYDGTKLIRLLGVDESGSQYACDQGNGIFDPNNASAEGANTQASITAMLTWGVNAVRIPLNEDCWLSNNLTTKSTPFSGTAYQTAIQNYVTLLLQNGIYPILDLHFTDAAGGASAMDVQQPMPDAANGGKFWTSVATMFKSQNKVIFDLFNEPFPDMDMDATSAWQCWQAGGSMCPGVSYAVIGMTGMLQAVRNAGATNFVVMGGLEYSNDLSQWLAYAPADNNIGVSWHVYSNSFYTSDHTLSADALPVLAKVPIVATEIGDGNNPPACNGQFITTVMDFLDNPGSGIPPQSYLAWSWSTDNMPALLSAYPGTATCDGPTYEAHLLTQQ